MACVLIVEDDEQVRVFAEAILEETYATLTAATAMEAVAILKGDAAIDLLFTDLHLNDDYEAGLRVAQEAVALRPRLRVLYTTGVGVTDGTRAMFVDGWTFLAKPYKPDELVTAASNALARPPG